MTNGAIANLKVTTQYKWTADPALSVTNTGALDSNFLGVNWGGYKGRIDSDNGDFGVIASPPPCPGFKFKVCAGGKPCGTVNNWH